MKTYVSNKMNAVKRMGLVWMLALCLQTSLDAAVVDHSGTLIADETWQASDVHLVVGDVSIPEGITLTIESGAIIQFEQGTRLSLDDGWLSAVGTVDRPIVFTSYRDAYNCSGAPSQSAAEPGDWIGITAMRSSWNAPSLHLEHVKVCYAGSENNSLSAAASIIADVSTSVIIRDSSILNGASTGLSLFFAKGEVTRTTISGHLGNGLEIPRDYIHDLRKRNTDDNEVYRPYIAFGHELEINENSITDSGGYGFVIGEVSTGSDKQTIKSFQNNIVTGNAVGGRLPFSALPNAADGNTLSPNIQDHVEVLGDRRYQDLILPPGPVYYLQDNTNANIRFGMTFTLQPGVVWKSGSETRFLIEGALMAIGTPSEPIIFTSYQDDSVGGDTDGQGVSTGQTGDWGDIRFDDSADNASRLEYVEIRYAGGANGYYDSNNQSTTRASLDIDRASPVVKDCVIRNGAKNGLYLYESAPTLEGNTISGNIDNGVASSLGVPELIGNTISDNGGAGLVIGDYTTIQNNVISSNGSRGIVVEGNGGTIRNNQITGNGVGPLFLFSSMPNPADGNILGPNERDIIGIRGDVRDTDLELVAGTVYHLGWGEATVLPGAVLAMQPGVMWKFGDESGLVVRGQIMAQGTAEAPIVFTSYSDDSIGGDSNGDGASSGNTGDWRGIRFEESADDMSRLQHVHVRFGGSSGNIEIIGANPMITDSFITSGSDSGVNIRDGSPTIRETRIWGNGKYGIFLEGQSNPIIEFSEVSTNGEIGIYTFGVVGSPSISFLHVFGNRVFGLRNVGSQTIEVPGTWWGDWDGSGPLNTQSNPSGNGDQVSYDVDFSFYRTSSPIEYSYSNFQEGGVEGFGVLSVATVNRGDLSNEWSTWRKEADRTIVWDEELIELAFSGLNPEKRYKIRVTLFDYNGSVSKLSISDQANRTVANNVIAPRNHSIQQEFSLPPASYDAGDLILRFVNQTPELIDSRVAVSEIWLLEDGVSLSASELKAIDYNDLDGSHHYSEGDELHFQFSHPMDTSLLRDGTEDANLRLAPSGGRVYGSSNQLRWSDDSKTLVVTLSPGFTVGGNEEIRVDNLLDKAGASVAGVLALPTVDSVAPSFTDVEWLDEDTSTTLSIGDKLVFRFNEKMDTTYLPDGTYSPDGGIGSRLDLSLRAISDGRYGINAAVTWSPDARSVTVTLASGFRLIGDELIDPSGALTDVAGNAVLGTQRLDAVDRQPPVFQSVQFDDRDGNGLLSVGDRYVFVFSEPMHTDALMDDSTDANDRLTPGTGRYGTANSISWNAQGTEVTVGITEGFTLEGTEQVVAAAVLSDLAGNPLDNDVTLSLQDTLPPQLVAVNASVFNPVLPRDDYRLTLRFDGAMDPAAEPQLALTGGGAGPLVPGGGVWSTTEFPSDTYTTPAIVIEEHHEGAWNLGVSAARDVAGNPMAEAHDVFTLVVGSSVFRATQYTPAPEIYAVNQDVVTIHGQRDPDTAVLLDGNEIAPVGSAPWSVAVTLTDGMNSLEFAELNSSGQQVAAFTLLFELDNQAPPAPQLDPVPGETIESAFTFSGTKEAGTSIWRDDVLVWPADQGTVWSFNVDLALGENSFEVIARDPAGNNSPPVIAQISRLDYVDPGPQISQLSFRDQPLTEGATLTASGTLSVRASDESGVTRVEFYLDDALIGSDSDADQTQTYSVFWDLSAVQNGTHALRVRALDGPGNPNELELTVSVLIDAAIDGDRDSMPDDWERRYGLDPMDPADALLDPDKDGLDNLEEYRAGTDPKVHNDSYAASVLAGGPVAYWPLHEAEGSTALDLSRNGHDGMYGQRPPETRGPLALPAPRFIESGQHLEVAVPPGLEGSAFSVEAWVRLDGVTGWRGIVARDTEMTGPLPAYALKISDTNRVLFELRDADGAVHTAESTRSPAVGRWRHVVAVYDGGWMRVYLDAVQEDETPYDGGLNGETGALLVGAAYYDDAPSDPLDGALAHVAIHGRALSATEIEARHDLGISQDSDGDFLPDVWEVHHGLEPLDDADALLDPDGDGLHSLAELQRGSDPRIHNNSYPGAVLADAPLAYWRLNDTAGETALDLSHRGHDGAYTGNPSATGGPMTEPTARFNGSSQYVEVPNPPDLGSEPFTIEAWMRPDALTGWHAIAARDSAVDAVDPAYVLKIGPDQRFTFDILDTGGVFQVLDGTSAAVAGQWHHLAGVYDGTQMRIYVNGVKEGERVYGGGVNGETGPLLIGAGFYDDQRVDYFNGAIGEFAFHRGAMTDAQIAERHDQGRTASAFSVTNYPAAPQVTLIGAAEVTLLGRRDDNTAIWVNGVEQVALGSGDWQVSLTLADGENTVEVLEVSPQGFGVASATLLFELDTQAPAAPVLDQLPADTFDTLFSFSGTKEAGTGIWRDGVAVWPVDQGTTWNFRIGLALGENSFEIVARDAAGNASAPVIARITRLEYIDPGPEITALIYRGAPLADGATVTDAGLLAAEAVDDSGVGRIEFLLDDVLLGADANPADGFAVHWDLLETTDGPHTLRVRALDTLGNASETSIGLTVDLGPPPAPTISDPGNGLVTNRSLISVAGNAEPGVEDVALYRDGNPQGTPLAVDEQGRFSGTVSLLSGVNLLQAAARHRGGESPRSAAISVTLDDSLPNPPSGLWAGLGAGGQVTLGWTAAPGDDVVGYHVYRHNQPFEDTTGLTRLNDSRVSDTRYSDAVNSDGTYYYRVVSVNALGTESLPSNMDQVSVDTTPPRALNIIYTPQGNFDPDTGRIAQGRVDVDLTVDEPLLSTPFLSVATDGGAPLTAVLQKVSDTQYEGYFDINAYAGTGTAYAVFSARDLAGNRGTTIEAGATLDIDTKGPHALRIDLNPGHPIRNDQAAPVNVAVTLELDEPTGPGESAELSVKPSLSAQSAIQVTLNSSDGIVWQGSFTLPANAGLEMPELLLFNLEAHDDLGNLGTRILDTRHTQVYQGDLPPLEVPGNCTAEALPGGRVRLSWHAVEQAADYQIYRGGPGQGELAPYARSGGVLEYIDEPAEDGAYEYAVASVRQANTQQAFSAPCGPVPVIADGLAPPAPANLVLELVGAGIQARWSPAQTEEAVSYRLYRSTIYPIASVDGMNPVVDGVEETVAVDPSPVSGSFAYAVTAVDAAGNESLPSNTGYLNFELLPVSSFHITREEGQAPSLSWSHNAASIDHFDLYLGDRTTGFKLNQSPLTATLYNDQSYTEGERFYTMVAVDVNGRESVGRGLLLPDLDVSLADGSQVLRGIMNRLEYELVNRGTGDVRNARIKAGIAGRVHQSEPFDLPAGQTAVVPVVVGGYPDLQDIEAVSTTVEINPNSGERVSLHGSHEVMVEEAGLSVGIAVQEMTRGSTGKVQFTLENSSDVELELITARNNGLGDSDQILFKLLDGDGNVLSTQRLRQYLGTRVLTLSNKTTVARIPPGESFTSEWVDLPVPSSAPDDVVLQVDIDALHYHYGRDTAVTIAGVNGRRSVPLVDTPYYGEVDSVGPTLSFGDELILISGRAISRDSGQPLGRAPMKLVLTIKGFEREIDVLTEVDGQFSYAYHPPAGEAGIYRVSLVHPDLVERPEHGRFTVGGLTLQYAAYRLNTAREYDQGISIQARASQGTSFSGVRLEMVAEDQPSGFLPAGITLTPATPITLGSNASGILRATFRADAGSGESGVVVLRAVSDQHAGRALDTLRVEYRLVDAAPVLWASPTQLSTGVTRGQSVKETVEIENKGLFAANDVRVSLFNPAGQVPDWMRIVSPAVLGDLAVGAAKTVTLAFSPGDSVPDGIYPVLVRFSSANAAPVEANVAVTVTPSGEGRVLFKIEDIYTNTKPHITGLSGARIRLQNEQLSTVTATFTSGAGGEVLTSMLPAGSYRYRVTAADHVEATGRIRVKAGVVSNERIFLDYNVVTVEWSVTETTIQDEYRITLKATYEVDVPTAVVAIEPSTIHLPSLTKGDVYYGELTLTNYGLVRADRLQLILPQGDEYLRYEMLLDSLPPAIEPKQRIHVPYRLTALRDFGADGAASGGGCFSYVNSVQVKSSTICANGEVVSRTAQSAFTHQAGGSCGGGNSGGIGLGFGMGGAACGSSGCGQNRGPSGGTVITDELSGLPACRPNSQTCPLGAGGGSSGFGSGGSFGSGAGGPQSILF